MIDANQLRHDIEKSPPDELPRVVGALSEALAVAQRRLVEPQPVQTSTDGRLVTADEMAEQLGIKKSWLLDMARQGRVPHVKLGRYVRFMPAEVLKSAREGS